MCGRYGFDITEEKLSKRFDLDSIGFELRKSWNVAPTHEMPVIERHSPNSVHLREWGIHPAWSSKILINAKTDRLATSRLWSKPFRESRCIVPASYFYEWKLVEDGSKQPYLIKLRDDEMMGFAGLIVEYTDEKGEKKNGYVIITTEPNKLLQEIHNVKYRMPIPLTKEDEDAWLNPDITEPERLESLLKVYPDREMEAYPVDKRVGSVQFNSPALMKPVGETIRFD